MKSITAWRELLLLFLMHMEMMAAAPTWYEASDGKRFLIDTEKKYNWYQAWNECARYDAQLVAIENEEKHHVLVKLLKNIKEETKNLWIGGNAFYDKIHFNWAVNEQEFAFTNWDTEEADRFGLKKQCVYLMRHKKNFPWNFVDCDAKEFGFVCEEMAISEELESTENVRNVEGRKGSMFDGSIYGLIG